MSTHQSAQFCAPDADVKFKSCDGVIFNIHSRQLNACAGAFPPQELEADKQDIVHLEEAKDTLEILFLFLYPRRHPDLKSTPFELLKDIAEAAEKYEVFAAVNICFIRMESFVAAHPLEIFQYAYKHGYRELLRSAASLLVYSPLSQSLVGMPSEIVMPWVQYHEKQHAAIHALFTEGTFYEKEEFYVDEDRKEKWEDQSPHSRCSDCSNVLGAVMCRVYKTPIKWNSNDSLTKSIEDAFSSAPTPQGRFVVNVHTFPNFKRAVEITFASIPPFDTMIYPDSDKEQDSE